MTTEATADESRQRIIEEFLASLPTELLARMKAIEAAARLATHIVGDVAVDSQSNGHPHAD